MTREELGRRSLIADALFCVAAGATAIGLSRPVARTLRAPEAFVSGTGVAAITWAGLVAALATRSKWRSSVRLVAIANLAASTGLVSVAVLHGNERAKLLLAGVGVEVAGFAAVQAHALR